MPADKPRPDPQQLAREKLIAKLLAEIERRGLNAAPPTEVVPPPPPPDSERMRELTAEDIATAVPAVPLLDEAIRRLQEPRNKE